MSAEDIKIVDLPPEQQVIAEVIGMEAYIKLSKWGGGSNVYIAKIENILRDKKIAQEYTGLNLRRLCQKYGLSTRQISNIILKYSSPEKLGQLSFFDS